MSELLIGGRWVACERTAEVRSPYDGGVAGQVAQASAEHVREAARLAGGHRSDLTAFDRAEILLKAAGKVEEAAGALARSIVSESGLAWKDAQKEIARAAGLLRFTAEEARRISGEAIPTDVTSARQRNLAITLRVPVGLVCAITPFNRPLNQVVVKVAPAIAAGCPVLLKPSEKTPLTALAFTRLLLECGLPPAMISVITGDPREIGDALVTDPHVAMVTFTGSSAVGKHIARRVGMIRTAFELGDSGALVVLHDADLAAAARAAAAGAHGTSGQSCRGVKRIIVEGSVADRFVELLAAESEKLKVGDPVDPATDIGTLISAAAAEEVARRMEDARARGARLVCGGERRGAQMWPAVLDHVPPDAPLVMEETFGPVAPVIRVRDFDEALRVTNGTRFGLQTGVYTGDLGRALRAAREIEAGAVIINGGPQFESPNIPFGGVKESGLGREGARHAILEMTTLKTIVLP